jgi:hypothetical protein
VFRRLPNNVILSSAKRVSKDAMPPKRRYTTARTIGSRVTGG